MTRRSAPTRLKVLSPRRAATVRWLVPVFCPLDTSEHIVADIVLEVDSMLNAMGSMTRRGIAGVLELIGGVAAVSRVRHPATRRRVISAIRRLGPARQLIDVVRDVIVIAYFGHQTVGAGLGYRPEEWTSRVSAERAARWSAEIAAHELVIRARAPTGESGQ